jgi:hypothetical protein
VTFCLRLPTLLLVTALVTACATARAPAATSTERTEPPQLPTHGAFPDLTVMGENVPSGPLPRLRLHVVVDSLGHADVKTLKLTGVGSGAQNRTAIERWLETITFRPATREGRPVSAVFEGTLAVRIVQHPY